ncbi:hypothetical protein MRX96_050060 [Rhipicephalus microplus]
MSSLPNLTEVESTTNCWCPLQFSAALAKLLRTSQKLRVLRIPKLHINGTCTFILLPSLVANSTLEELSVHSSAISKGRPEHRSSFARFLACAKALKKLSIGAHNEVRQLFLKWVLEVLLSNTSLSEITLEDHIVDVSSAELMTMVLRHNYSLRVLNIPSLTYDTCMKRVGESTTPCQADFSAWLPALAANETLEAVTLPLKIWQSEQCEYLFGILSARRRPLKLTIKGHWSERYLWERLCGALRKTGMEEQVFFDTSLYILQEHKMIDCKAFSEFCSFCYEDYCGEVARMFRLLPSLTHVTTAHLEVCISDVFETISADIAHYIATKSALKELHLTIWHLNMAPQAAEIGWAGILESLRQNTSVNELGIAMRYVGKPEIQLLADTLSSCQNVRRAHVGVGDPAAFVRRLRDGIEGNFNLLRLTIDGYAHAPPCVSKEWFAIWNVTRRNSDHVARAAQYLSGTLVDRYGAEALERIGKHPPLQQEVAQLLSVSEAGAAALVRAELRAMQTLDGFMRAAGVVRNRVRCERREDGHMQLDELIQDCWSLIRRHLKVRDVADPAATVLPGDL